MSQTQAAAAPAIDIAAVQAALRGRRPRRLAAVRLPRPQSDRGRRHRRRPQGGHLATRRWYLPDSGHRRAARPGARDRDELARASARHDRRGTPAATQLEAGLRDAAARACAASRWSIRPAARFPTSRASTPARSSSSASRASRSCRRAISSSGSRPSGTTRPSRRIAQASEKLYRVKDRAFDAIARRLRDGVATTEFDIQQLMAGWFARRRARQRLGRRTCRPAENAGNPHYLPTATAHRTIRRGRAGAARPLGQARSTRARCLPTSPGWATPGATVPERFAHGVRRGRATRATRPSRWSSRRPRAGRELRGWEVDRAASAVLRERRLRRPDPAPHRPQPRRVGPRQRRQHGRLRNARRPAAAARHRLHDRARRLLRRLRRSDGNQHDRRRRATRRSPGRCRPRFVALV